MSIEERTVWIHFADFDGNHEDYSVSNWESAHQEAIDIINNHKSFVCDNIKLDAIIDGLATDKWRDAVALFNEAAACNVNILFREGKPVYG